MAFTLACTGRSIRPRWRDRGVRASGSKLRYNSRMKPSTKFPRKGAARPNLNTGPRPVAPAALRNAPPTRRQIRPQAGPQTDWQQFAGWYDQLVGDAGNDYHQKVILPGVVKLLGVLGNKRVLDVACGQGVLCRHVAKEGAVVTGVDAAESLLAAARERSAPGAAVQYLAADVRKLGETPGLSAMRFDAGIVTQF